MDNQPQEIKLSKISARYAGYNGIKSRYNVFHQNGTVLGSIYFSPDYNMYVFCSAPFPIVYSLEALQQVTECLNIINGK